jgi:mannose/cellobiose epimerase-like protein (N-acyl-D-glucosamine 2-epimerase family)
MRGPAPAAVAASGSSAFLRAHLHSVLDHYQALCVDPRGGFFEVDGEGSPDAKRVRSLVGTARMIVNLAIGYLHTGDERRRGALRHGLRFLREVHRDPQSGGYAWCVERGIATPGPQRCYGLAFVALAYARAVQCGVDEALPWLRETWALIDARFWEPAHQLYADEAGTDGALTGDRGQNANMHACEALLVAYEATGDSSCLQRAATLADRVVNGLAQQTGGLIWERFDSDWRVDGIERIGQGADRYRVNGVQPGHLAEWAKLLLILERHDPAPWLLARARALFDRAVAIGWDPAFGGVVHACDLAGNSLDADKYGWVQAECLAAAGLLAKATGSNAYQDCYARLWDYAWRCFVDHPHQAWFRVLDRDHRASPGGRARAGRTDYHIVTACHELLIANGETVA